jgi:hypothetical protein
MDFVRPADQTVWTYGFGLAMVLALVFLIGGLVSVSRLPRTVKALIWLGLGFRVVGSFARFQVLQLFYGAGDATGYFGKGLVFAQSFRQLDFAPITQGKEWYGTEFVRSVSGLVLAIIGPSMFAEYIVFSIFAFIGLVGFAVAFRRSYPTTAVSRYLLLIWLFPSLWFWPSSIGKEALILMGLGIAVMGFVGQGKRINLPILILGSCIMFAVRPQVLAVFMVSVIVAQWLSFEGRWTSSRLVQGGLLLVVGLVGLSYTMQTIGIEEMDVEGIVEYVEGDKSRRTTGGSSVEAVGTGVKDLPLAAVNILFRPLPWEARNPMVLLSSLEVVALWVIVFMRRRNLVRSLRDWRTDRLLRLAIAFVVIYSVALGLMLVNIGIIARQRIFLFPFLFILLEALPHPKRAKVSSGGVGAWQDETSGSRRLTRAVSP